ncbi:MAG: hypothetical protein VXZ59_01510 [Cyanobacteriota bacterium]|nr:hypothetical protein [Cyanobacteriota bacterium]
MMDGNGKIASMGEMNDQAGLEALVADLGGGNVIDAELLEGCSVEAHELDEMGPEEAAQVAAHCFATLFGHTVESAEGRDGDADEGRWSGTLDGFGFVISRDDLGDLVLDFSGPVS